MAFTFIPALAARVLSLRRGGERPGRAVGPAGGGRPGHRPLYVRFYGDVVGFTVRHPWLSALVTAGVFAGSYQLFDRYVTTWTIFGGSYNFV